MKITLSPTASNKTTTVSLSGLILTIDGTPYDLSVIPIGGQADGETPFVGIVTRDEMTVQYHYDSKLAEPMQSTNMADYIFNVMDGDMPCPINWRS